MSPTGGYELISRCETFPNEKLTKLASTGSDAISLSGVLKYIKLAYTYEFWDYYSLAVSHFLPAIEVNMILFIMLIVLRPECLLVAFRFLHELSDKRQSFINICHF